MSSLKTICVGFQSFFSTDIEIPDTVFIIGISMEKNRGRFELIHCNVFEKYFERFTAHRFDQHFFNWTLL